MDSSDVLRIRVLQRLGDGIMSKINKIVASQVEARNTDDRFEENTYSFGSDGVLNRHDVDRVGRPVVGPGVLFGANKDSADQSGLNTIKLIPNDELTTEQYIVVEPTGPNHIHIRAGGQQDNSSADLILGGEKAQVKVTDFTHKVHVQSWDDGNDIYHSWQFGSDGKIYGPGEDGTLILGGELVTQDVNMSIRSNGQSVVLNGSLGEFLGSSDSASSQIATVGDIANSHGNFVFQDSNLSVYDSTMQIKAYGADEVTVRGEVVLNPGSDSGRFRVYDDQTQESFSAANWATATWTSTSETSSQLVLTGASGIFDYFNTMLRPFNQTISINGNTPGKLDGWGGNGTDITIYILDMPVGVDPTVNSVDVYSANASTIILDYDENEMLFDAQGLNINMTTTGNRDISLTSADEIRITATGNDLINRSGDDILFISSYNNLNKTWSMDSEGKFQLPGQGYIENPSDSSGDGNGYDTLRLIPDAELEEFDQYLIIDPTQTNHIHIRAGGEQDKSTADLILGGEKTNVTVSDASGQVRINTKIPPQLVTYANIAPAELSGLLIVAAGQSDPQVGDYIDYNGSRYTVVNFAEENPGEITVYAVNTQVTPQQSFPADGQVSYTFSRDYSFGPYWTFENNGYLSGWYGGSLGVYGLYSNETGAMPINAVDKLLLLGGNGEFLNDADVPSNQIATIGDVANRLSGYASFYSVDDQFCTAGSIQPMKTLSLDMANNVGVGGIDNSHIVMQSAGKYNIAFSAQLQQTNGSASVYIWLNKNGSPVPNSNTLVTLSANDPYRVAAWNWFVDAAANDYYEIMWRSNSQHTNLQYISDLDINVTGVPGVPSVIVTVNQVG